MAYSTYIYPEIHYDPDFKGYEKLGTPHENEMVKPICVSLVGDIIRFESCYSYNEQDAQQKLPAHTMRMRLYSGYIDGKKMEYEFQFSGPLYRYWDYDVMGALKQMNKKDNEYAIYSNFAILRNLIKKIEYLPEIPYGHYSKDHSQDVGKAYEYFFNGHKTPIFKIYRVGGGCSIVGVSTSIEEAEKIFGVKIQIMPNPNTDYNESTYKKFYPKSSFFYDPYTWSSANKKRDEETASML